MDKLIRTINGTKRTYVIYNKVEADNKGLTYKYWKDADIGDNALTDDDYVGICLKRKDYSDKQGRVKTFVTLSCGVGWTGGNAKIEYEENKAFGIYSQSKPTYWADKEVRTTRFKNAVAVYVEQLLSTNEIDWDIIGNVYRPNQKTPAATVRRLFKQQKVKDVIEDKLKETMKDKGITQEMVLELHMEAIDIARNKKDPSNMLRGTENLMDLLEMIPGKRIVTESLEMGVTSNIADQIESEEKRLKLEQKTEEPIDRSTAQS